MDGVDIWARTIPHGVKITSNFFLRERHQDLDLLLSTLCVSCDSIYVRPRGWRWWNSSFGTAVRTESGGTWSLYHSLVARPCVMALRKAISTKSSSFSTALTLSRTWTNLQHLCFTSDKKTSMREHHVLTWHQQTPNFLSSSHPPCIRRKIQRFDDSTLPSKTSNANIHDINSIPRHCPRSSRQRTARLPSYPRPLAPQHNQSSQRPLDSRAYTRSYSHDCLQA